MERDCALHPPRRRGHMGAGIVGRRQVLHGRRIVGFNLTPPVARYRPTCIRLACPHEPDASVSSGT